MNPYPYYCIAALIIAIFAIYKVLKAAKHQSHSKSTTIEVNRDCFLDKCSEAVLKKTETVQAVMPHEAPVCEAKSEIRKTIPAPDNHQQSERTLNTDFSTWENHQLPRIRAYHLNKYLNPATTDISCPNCEKTLPKIDDDCKAICSNCKASITVEDKFIYVITTEKALS